jgi:hypothetical protein
VSPTPFAFAPRCVSHVTPKDEDTAVSPSNLPLMPMIDDLDLIPMDDLEKDEEEDKYLEKHTGNETRIVRVLVETGSDDDTLSEFSMACDSFVHLENALQNGTHENNTSSTQMDDAVPIWDGPSGIHRFHEIETISSCDDVTSLMSVEEDLNEVEPWCKDEKFPSISNDVFTTFLRDENIFVEGTSKDYRLNIYSEEKEDSAFGSLELDCELPLLPEDFL